MVRVKRGNTARKYRKKILNFSKGFRGAHSRLFRVANQQVLRSWRNSYIGRKNKKRFFRRLWIVRINIASRKIGLPYSRFIAQLKQEQIGINRKMLAHMATMDPKTLSILSNPNLNKPSSKKEWFDNWNNTIVK
uniref:50S ribosomal protein L20 n=1 Tax=Eustigmatophyceae sp. Mont 10/10-1w TaxID=2506145 RepID=A0A451FMW9_9STRA|nr:ribosomal protein L20 [Eustigmatophyceae sp. Mont 10/10-1w]QAA11766.1 ribosomal protein L20 [Eustigmatophyceae sp. Mont 10/10-1w]